MSAFKNARAAFEKKESKPAAGKSGKKRSKGKGKRSSKVKQLQKAYKRKGKNTLPKDKEKGEKVPWPQEKTVPVTEEMARKGLEVVRGPDWSYYNQDGGAGYIGVLKITVGTDRWLVKWTKNEKENGYCVKGPYELALAYPEGKGKTIQAVQKKPKEPEKKIMEDDRKLDEPSSKAGKVANQKEDSGEQQIPSVNKEKCADNSRIEIETKTSESAAVVDKDTRTEITQSKEDMKDQEAAELDAGESQVVPPKANDDAKPDIRVEIAVDEQETKETEEIASEEVKLETNESKPETDEVTETKVEETQAPMEQQTEEVTIAKDKELPVEEASKPEQKIEVVQDNGAESKETVTVDSEVQKEELPVEKASKPEQKADEIVQENEIDTKETETVDTAEPVQEMTAQEDAIKKPEVLEVEIQVADEEKLDQSKKKEEVERKSEDEMKREPLYAKGQVVDILHLYNWVEAKIVGHNRNGTYEVELQGFYSAESRVLDDSAIRVWEPKFAPDATVDARRASEWVTAVVKSADPSQCTYEVIYQGDAEETKVLSYNEVRSATLSPDNDVEDSQQQGPSAPVVAASTPEKLDEMGKPDEAKKPEESPDHVVEPPLPPNPPIKKPIEKKEPDESSDVLPFKVNDQVEILNDYKWQSGVVLQTDEDRGVQVESRKSLGGKQKIWVTKDNIRPVPGKPVTKQKTKKRSGGLPKKGKGLPSPSVLSSSTVGVKGSQATEVSTGEPQPLRMVQASFDPLGAELPAPQKESEAAPEKEPEALEKAVQKDTILESDNIEQADEKATIDEEKETSANRDSLPPGLIMSGTVADGTDPLSAATDAAPAPVVVKPVKHRKKNRRAKGLPTVKKSN